MPLPSREKLIKLARRAGFYHAKEEDIIDKIIKNKKHARKKRKKNNA